MKIGSLRQNFTWGWRPFTLKFAFLQLSVGSWSETVKSPVRNENKCPTFDWMAWHQTPGNGKWQDWMFMSVCVCVSEMGMALWSHMNRQVENVSSWFIMQHDVSFVFGIPDGKQLSEVYRIRGYDMIRLHISPFFWILVGRDVRQSFNDIHPIWGANCRIAICYKLLVMSSRRSSLHKIKPSNLELRRCFNGCPWFLSRQDVIWKHWTMHQTVLLAEG